MNRRRWFPRLAAPVALVAALAASPACGLSTNDEPETLRSDAPPELGGEAPPRSAPPVPGVGVGAEDAPVWFLRSDQTGVSYYMESRPRLVEDEEVPVQVLQALFQQVPNGLERADGITTFVPEDARLLGRPRLRGDVLEVNLSESFYDLQGDSSRYAFAQVVYTVTEIDGINEVRFLNEGRGFEVVDGAGQSRDRPVDREDYRNLEADE